MTYITKDVVDWAREYSGPQFHALLCDPPYHLTSITKRFAKPSELDYKVARTNPYRRTSKGFMGQVWDGGDVAFQSETWALLAEHLYPGAFGMAFASSRGWHRLAVAIEDAGLIIHPSIFGWLYGSGFPKATRIITDDPRAEIFDGHRYGLQALKPALEPIIVFQKPYNGSPRENIFETGAGVLNIDGARIQGGEPYTVNTWNDTAHPFGHGAGNEYESREESARWPSNFILDTGAAERLGNPITSKLFFEAVNDKIAESDPVYFCSKASPAEREGGLSGMEKVEGRVTLSGHTRNGDGSERKETYKANIHPTVKPIALTKYLATLLLPPAEYSPRRLLVPFAGVASEMIGARLAGWDDITGIELTPDYADIARARFTYWAGAVQMAFDNLFA